MFSRPKRASQNASQVRDAPLVEGPLTLSGGGAPRRRYCALVAAAWTSSGAPRGPCLLEDDDGDASLPLSGAATKGADALSLRLATARGLVDARADDEATRDAWLAVP